MSRSLQANLVTIPDVVGISARTVVALPPSDLDPKTVEGGTTYDSLTIYDTTTTYDALFHFGAMQVYVHGTRITRYYDSSLDMP